MNLNVLFGCSMWKFPGQGSNLHHSYNQSHSIDNTRSLTHWATRELLNLILFFFFWAAFCSMWKFLGQGLNLSCNCDLCCSCSNAGSFNPLCQARDQICRNNVRSLIHCTTMETPLKKKKLRYNWFTVVFQVYGKVVQLYIFFQLIFHYKYLYNFPLYKVLNIVPFVTQ